MKTIRKSAVRNLIVMILAFTLAVSAGITANAADIRYSGLRDALDAIPLTPQSTGITVVDDYLDQVLALVTTPEMDTHDKLKACYDYLIAAVSYGIPDSYFEYLYMYGEYGQGVAAMMEGLGVCRDYSWAFSMLANRIGVSMTVVSGQTHAASGGYTGHAWCELNMGNGTVYIFDPQVEDAIAGRQGGTISYLRFGGTTEQLADKYIHDYETYETSASSSVPAAASDLYTEEEYEQWAWEVLQHYNQKTGLNKNSLYIEIDNSGMVIYYVCDEINGELVIYDAYVINIYSGTGYTMSGEAVDLTSVS